MVRAFCGLSVHLISIDKYLVIRLFLAGLPVRAVPMMIKRLSFCLMNIFNCMREKETASVSANTVSFNLIIWCILCVDNLQAINVYLAWIYIICACLPFRSDYLTHLHAASDYTKPDRYSCQLHSL